MRAQQGVWVLAGAAVATLLLLGTMTSMFEPIAHLLPKRTHLFGHFLAHALLSVAALHAVTDGVCSAEMICAISIVLAVMIEVAQSVFVPARKGTLADIAAATVGSFAVFLFPRQAHSHGNPLHRLPWGWGAFMSQFMPVATTGGDNDTDDEDDDDDDYAGNGRDSHRVGSWAV